MLKAAREAKGMTIEDLYLKTKIRPHIIAAIEAGEFERITVGAVYLRGFIRTLSDELGVDSAKLPLSAAATPTASADAPAGTYRRVRPVPWRRWAGVAIMLTALLGAGLYYAYRTSPPLPPPEQPPQVTLPPTVSPETPTPEDPPTPPLPAWTLRESVGIRDVIEVRAWPLELVVRVRTESCWLSVNVDGERSSMTLMTGEARTFRANERIDLRLGRARVVDIVVNGSLLPAQTGDVREYAFVKPNP
jgi:hypothetical protein